MLHSHPEDLAFVLLISGVHLCQFCQISNCPSRTFQKFQKCVNSIEFPPFLVEVGVEGEAEAAGDGEEDGAALVVVPQEAEAPQRQVGYRVEQVPAIPGALVGTWDTGVIYSTRPRLYKVTHLVRP